MAETKLLPVVCLLLLKVLLINLVRCLEMSGFRRSVELGFNCT